MSKFFVPSEKIEFLQNFSSILLTFSGKYNDSLESIDPLFCGKHVLFNICKHILNKNWKIFVSQAVLSILLPERNFDTDKLSLLLWNYPLTMSMVYNVFKKVIKHQVIILIAKKVKAIGKSENCIFFFKMSIILPPIYGKILDFLYSSFIYIIHL